MDNFNYIDSVGRDQFKTEFEQYYHIQDTTSQYDRTDFGLTACTSNTCYQIELKKRNYDIEVLSASTIIEANKVNEFERLYNIDPKRCSIYFNYYLGGSWIAYDMTNRLKTGSNLIISTQQLPATTASCSRDDMVSKQIYYLCYTNDGIINDKICVRCSNF